MNYKETQYGWFIIIIFFLIILFIFFSYSEQWGSRPIPKIPFLIMDGLFILLLALFYKMVVRIEDKMILIIYGIGFIKIKLKPERVIGVESFKAPWYWGIGIRMTPKGWLYSLSGFKSVMIKYKIKEIKKTTLIGTPNPEQLKAAIEHHFSSITEKDKF